MTTKLLKKLRKLAKKEYWLEDHKDYKYRYRLCASYCDKDCFIKSFLSYEDALEELTCRRRSWILDYIRDHKNYKLDV